MKKDIYIPIIVFFVLNILTYFLLGIQILISNILMLSFYALLVPSLFFTYGSYIEKETTKNQVERLIQSFLKNAQDLEITIPQVTIPVDKTADKRVKDENDMLIENSFLYLSIFFITGICLSLLLWKYSREKFKFKKILYEALFLIFIVAIIEIIFFGLITKNYRALDSNEIKEFVLKTLSSKTKPP